jgi:hypothetical protein
MRGGSREETRAGQSVDQVVLDAELNTVRRGVVAVSKVVTAVHVLDTHLGCLERPPNQVTAHVVGLAECRITFRLGVADPI